MKTFDVFIAYLFLGDEGKARPVLVHSQEGDKAAIYRIIPKHHGARDADYAHCFRIVDWWKVGLGRPSYVDIGVRFQLPKFMFDGRTTIGRLTNADLDSFLIFLDESKNETAVSTTTSPFYRQVHAVISQIPEGMVMSYGQIARILGRPRAAREVGWALRYCPEGLPWQRVVRADGAIAGGEQAELRRQLLAAESVTFLNDGRVNMKICCVDM